jgi:tetratricopeptide (TPR) repeat protein
MRLATNVVAMATGALVCASAGAETLGLDGLMPPPPPASAGALPAGPQALALAQSLQALTEGRFDEAEALARKVTEDAPDMTHGWYLLGLALANLGRIDEALPALRKSADLYAGNAQPLVVSGDLLRTLGRMDEAQAAYAEAVQRDPGNWQAQDGLGTLLAATGDQEAALAHLRAAVDAAPPSETDPALHYGVALLRAGRPDEAATALAAAAALPDAPLPVLETAARAALGAGDGDAARGYLQRIAEGGHSPAGRLGLAELALQAGDTAAAETELSAAREEYPKSTEVLSQLGNLYGATRRYEEALEVYSEALALAPGNPALIKAASLAEMRLGRLDAAADHAEMLAARPGATGADLAWLATLREMQGKPEAARESYARAIEMQPDNWLALNNLAALTTEDDPARALDLAERAQKLAPDVPAVQDTLAWAAFRAGDVGQASSLYEELHADAPQDPVIAYRLGMVRLAQGQREEGRALIEAALRTDPTFRYAEEAKAALAGD